MVRVSVLLLNLFVKKTEIHVHFFLETALEKSDNVDSTDCVSGWIIFISLSLSFLACNGDLEHERDNVITFFLGRFCCQ